METMELENGSTIEFFDDDGGTMVSSGKGELWLWDEEPLEGE